jgi:ABC-2 type transport system permease protein
MESGWRIARKDLLLRLRDRSAFVLGVGVPFVLALIFDLVFGGAFAGESVATVGIANTDQGEVAVALDQTLDVLVEDEVISVVQASDEDSLVALVEEGQVEAGIYVPPGLTAAVMAGETAEITVIGQVDALIAESLARGVVTSFTSGVADAQRGIVAVARLPGPGIDPAGMAELAAALGTAPPVVTVGAVSAADRVLDPSTFFAASMAVFFVFFMVQFGVTGLLDEEREGTLARLQAAPIRRSSIVVGKAITSVLLGVTSLTVLWLASTFLMGADWGLPLGVVILIVCVVLAATSIIGIVAGVTRTPEGAGNVGAVIAVGLGMLGGTFFPLGGGNRVLEALTLATPHAWFLRGIGSLSAGDGLVGILPAVGALLAFGVVMGVIASLLLRRRFA